MIIFIFNEIQSSSYEYHYLQRLKILNRQQSSSYEYQKILNRQY